MSVTTSYYMTNITMMSLLLHGAILFQAARSRQRRLEALEAPGSSSARRRGVWHEARHVAKARRAVTWADAAAPQWFFWGETGGSKTQTREM